ncbi:putative Elongation factor 1-beta [groundwater metagenome]|uniref:Elongation factor 1-beta n=1 Tax=groundwater metagenome TaxID=717931 RepID=A0A098EDC1_9ZZZZ
MGKEIKKFNMVAKLRIMPKGIEVDLKKVENEIKEILSKCETSKFHSAEVQPIAFGLKSLEVAILITEAKSELESIEDKISKLPDVENVTEIDINLLSEI